MRLDAVTCLALLQLWTAQAAVIERQEMTLQALLIDPQGAVLQPLAAGLFPQVTDSPSATPSDPGASETPSSTSSGPCSSSASDPTNSPGDFQPTPAVTDISRTTSTTAAPQPTSTKLVFAHHIVGNTYNYTQSTWANDIKLASSKGIDAFALNIGVDSWEPGQVSNAYAAARSLNTPFKLFFSFDMTSFPCASANNAAILRQYIHNYTSHPNQLLYKSKVFVSTFAGQDCTFGARSVDQGWYNTVKSGMNTYFVPSFFVDPATFKSYSALDGAFGWNSGWPMGDYNITFDQDQSYISNLPNRSYMAAASPWFFTHYGPDTYNKNFIYRGDDWLLSQRWEALVANRSMVDFVEVNTWNDFGESHYVGPIEGIQPMSQAWVNGFDHTGWLDLISYYASAFKTGSYPKITRDRTFLWARLFPAAANATNDHVARPTNIAAQTEDYLWAVVQLTAPANVTLACGPNSATASVPAGTTKLKLPLTANCTVSSTVARGTVRTTFAPPGMAFNTAPVTYNFNAFVAASA